MLNSRKENIFLVTCVETVLDLKSMLKLHMCRQHEVLACVLSSASLAGNSLKGGLTYCYSSIYGVIFSGSPPSKTPTLGSILGRWMNSSGNIR